MVGSVLQDREWPWDEPYYEHARWDVATKKWIPTRARTEPERILAWVVRTVRPKG
jgi:hypothetical protein